MFHIVFPRQGNAQRIRNDARLSEKLGFRDSYNFTVKDFQPLDQSGHFPVEQLRQANVEAKRIAESIFENYARAECICHFEPASAKAASDSVSCSLTASTVKRDIGMPNVVRVCGEMNKMIDSILSGISLRTPTYLPPPASTIEDISASLKRAAIEFSYFRAGLCRPTLFPTISLAVLFPGERIEEGWATVFTTICAGSGSEPT